MEAGAQLCEAGHVSGRHQPAARSPQLRDVVVEDGAEPSLFGRLQPSVGAARLLDDEIGMSCLPAGPVPGGAEVGSAHCPDRWQHLVAPVGRAEDHGRLVDEPTQPADEVGWWSPAGERFGVVERERPGEDRQRIQRCPLARLEQAVRRLDHAPHAVVAAWGRRSRAIEQREVLTDPLRQGADIDPRDATGGELEGEREAAHGLAQLDRRLPFGSTRLESGHRRPSAIQEQLEPSSPELQHLLGAIAGNAQAMDEFASVVAGTLSPAALFDREHIGRLVGSAK